VTHKPRVFLDANVLIRGVTFPRFPYEVLQHAARKEIAAIVSPLVLDSVRLYVREQFPDHLGALEALLELLDLEVAPDPPREEVEAHSALVRDPKDIPVALAAIRARAEYLVSTDRDFTDVDDTTAELRRHLKPLPVGVFLREVMGWSHESLSAIERRRWSDLERPFWEEQGRSE
jgi:putative PIN family toxin of toxin-antitoxin system